MRDGVVVVHHDLVDHFLGLLNGSILAGKHDLVLLASRWVLWSFGDLDSNTKLILDLPDDNSTLANDLWEVGRMNRNEILLEIIKLQSGVAFLNKIPDRNFGLSHSRWRAGDCEDFPACVNASTGLLLDELDLRPLRTDHNTDLCLWYFHGRGGRVALFLFFCLSSGGCCCSSDCSCLCWGCSHSLRSRWCRSRCRSNRSHTRNVLQCLAWLYPQSLCLGLFSLDTLLTLLLLLREACGDLPIPTSAVIKLNETLQTGLPLSRLLLFHWLGCTLSCCLGLCPRFRCWL
mmetsp:Transcript_17959/g.51030  ORF Transcript_17959/g.51030 Transcript_17959/m.51030 type:complete len:288 (-) Transcript_17959:427-1290(-)